MVQDQDGAALSDGLSWAVPEPEEPTLLMAPKDISDAPGTQPHQHVPATLQAHLLGNGAQCLNPEAAGASPRP